MFHNHGHIYRVEISFAMKASGKIRFRVCRRDELRANRTKEAKISVRDLRGQVQNIRDQSRYRYLVSQLHQFLLGIFVWHAFSPCYGRWNSDMVSFTSCALICLRFFETALIRHAVAMLLIDLGIPPE